MSICFTAFRTFFRIGLFTVGGGYAMIPLIEDETVRRHRWVSREEFLDLLAVAQTVPGVFAVNLSIFIGYRLRKFPGALSAALGTILPSFLIILGLALFFRGFRQYPLVDHFFLGLRPAVVALIASPVFSLWRSAGISRYTCWIPLLSALLIWAWGVSPVQVILLAAVGGLVYGKFEKRAS